MLIQCTAALLKEPEKNRRNEQFQLVQIEWLEHEVWRCVRVPGTFSFLHLHRIIQIVFDWHDSHLHEFTVLWDNEKHLTIMMSDDPEWIDYVDEERFDVILERFTQLIKFLKTMIVLYTIMILAICGTTSLQWNV